MVIAMTASAIDAFAPTCQKERGETLMASCNTKKIETRYDYLDIGSGPRVEINQRLMSRSHTHTQKTNTIHKTHNAPQGNEGFVWKRQQQQQTRGGT